MNEINEQNDLSGWFSTYGVITAQRLLERYQIKLAHDDLLHALKTPYTFYHHLMKAPLRNVFNGIILQQTRDYQLYAQKLFIDYLLSGENGKNETALGSATREELEQEQAKLVEMNERFHQLELDHEKLIAQSQSTLIAEAAHWQKILLKIANDLKQKLKNALPLIDSGVVLKALIALLVRNNIQTSHSLTDESWKRVDTILATTLDQQQRQLFSDELSKLASLHVDLNEDLASYIKQIAHMSVNVRQFRTDFYQFILHANQLLQALPEYRPDNRQMEQNRAALQFDPALGEASST